MRRTESPAGGAALSLLKLNGASYENFHIFVHQYFALCIYVLFYHEVDSFLFVQTASKFQHIVSVSLEKKVSCLYPRGEFLFRVKREIL